MDKLISTNEACRILRIVPSTLYRWKERGIITGIENYRGKLKCFKFKFQDIQELYKSKPNFRVGHGQYDIVGKTFDKLTVLKRAPNRNTRQSWWLCKCECGKEKEVRGRALIGRLIKSCGCHRYKWEKINTIQWKGYEEISGRYWHNVKRAALIRNIDFNISIQEAWQKFLDQNRKCALTGKELNFVRNYGRGKKGKGVQTASLDRIDSQRGYVSGNIQWVNVKINKLKSDFNEAEFIALCYAVANYKKIQAN